MEVLCGVEAGAAGHGRCPDEAPGWDEEPWVLLVETQKAGLGYPS